jgi:hypothetical protein
LRRRATCGSLVAMQLGPKVLAVVGLFSLLGGCGGSLPPFDTAPRPAPANAHENFTRIGVCYNAMTARRRDVVAVAGANCDAGTTPYLLSDEFNLNCPLLLPERATFACLKPGTTPPVQP